MSPNKIIYWLSTGIMCLIFLFSVQMYLFQNEMVQGFFKHLGFPLWMIYPLAILKILGVVAILTKKSKLLKEWAYAGFTFDAIAALAAHHFADGSGYLLSGIALVATLVSRYFDGPQLTRQL